MRVTMKEIASKLNISINAVSLALNNKAGIGDELRVKILRTAESMGYIGTKEKFMRTLSQSHLCILMQQMYATDLNFYTKVVYAIVEEAKRDGYEAIMNYFSDEDMSVPKCIEEHRVAGIIVVGKIKEENIYHLKEYHVPIVLVDHASLANSVDSILTDNKSGAYMATKYLMENGFQKIGFFGDLNYSLSIKERFFGFREAIATAEAVNLEEYTERYSITKNIEDAVIKNDSKSIVKLIKSRKELPEAFVCSNDRAAVALLMALNTLNYRVPDDISLVGFDNNDMSDKVCPKLTTVNVNKERMGIKAVQRILQLITTRNRERENIVMNVELVKRESVKKHV